MSEKKRFNRRELLATGAALGAAAIVGPACAQDGKPGKALSEQLLPEGAGAETALPQVPRRVLGKTGDRIPILLQGGGMGFDLKFDPKLAEGLRFGVNVIDTADCYAGGQSEKAVGSFMQQVGDRKKHWILSKSDRHDPAGFEEVLDTSLENLQSDYVDLYFLHALRNPDFLSPELEKVVKRLKREGKLRFFGFSCHHGNVAELLHSAAETPWCDAVMFRYNFRQYGDKELNEAMDAAHKAGVGLIAMKTQGSEASFADAWQKFEQTGKWTKHQAVLKAVWSDERITAATSHMDTFEKLKQNIAAALDRSELTAREHKALWDYAEATRTLACDGCDHHCNPAVDAPVRIGDTMRCLMYHDVYGDRKTARELFAKLPARARRLDGVDFAPASRACPHGLDVALHMKRAAKVLA
jgi:predicted aldo/keto reductase-like oxidoreductase